MSFCLKDEIHEACSFKSMYAEHKRVHAVFLSNRQAIISMIDARGPTGQDEYDLEWLASEQDQLTSTMEDLHNRIYNAACAQCPYVPPKS